MSAFSRLWHRAPVWRLCLYSIFIFSILMLVFPPAYLGRLWPGVQNITQRIHHALGMNDAPPPSDNAGGGDDGVVTMMPITDRLTKAIPFAGRILPLPAGVWHPVMNVITGPHGEILENVLVRVHDHVVTGLIGAEASTQALPETAALSMDSSCHDDRNLAAHVMPAKPPGVECWFTAAVYPTSITRTAIIANRLKELGFTLPNVLYKASWTLASPSPDHTVNMETVTIFLNPVATDKTASLQSPDDWAKETLSQHPAALNFVQKGNSWMETWAHILHDGFNSDMMASSEEQRARASQDPTAPTDKNASSSLD